MKHAVSSGRAVCFACDFKVAGIFEIVLWLNIGYNGATRKAVSRMQIIPMRDLKNTVEIERRCAEENGPVFVTKNGYGRLVVMDIEYYERIIRKLYEAKIVQEGLEDLKAGRTVDGAQAVANIRSKYGE